MRRLARLVHELGPGTALLYLLGRGLQRLGGGCALDDLLLYRQPVRAEPLLPPGRGAAIEIRTMTGAQAIDAGLTVAPDLAAGRRREDVHCLAAYRDGALIGQHWLDLGPHDDEMVRCRYATGPATHSAWSYDMAIVPAHRGGLAYARLTDATHALLRTHGRLQIASYIVAANRPAIAAEQRLGGKRLGRALHLRLGPAQLLVASLPPYLHLSFSDRHRPVMRLES